MTYEETLYTLNYLYLRLGDGWVERTITVKGEAALMREMRRLTSGVVKGNKIIQKIQREAN